MTGGAGRRWRLVRARTDAVPASLRRFTSLRRAARRRMGRGGPWTVVGATVVMAVLAGWVLWGSTLLAVQEVRITGLDLLSPAEVHAAAGVADHTPMLRVDRAEVADRVDALAPVAAVAVERAWPRTLVIHVVERTGVAVVSVGERLHLMDAEGVLFHPVAQPPVGLPTLALAEPGPDDPATRAALVVLAALTPQLESELETLTVTGPARIRLELTSGPTVVWGDETTSDEKARVATALLERGQAGPEQVIDVSSPQVVVLR